MIRINEVSFKGSNTFVSFTKLLNNGDKYTNTIKLDKVTEKFQAAVESFSPVVNKVCEFNEGEESLLTISKIKIKYIKDMQKIQIFANRYLEKSESGLELTLPEKFLGHEQPSLNFPSAEASETIEFICKEAVKFVTSSLKKMKIDNSLFGSNGKDEQKEQSEEEQEPVTNFRTETPNEKAATSVSKEGNLM